MRSINYNPKRSSLGLSETSPGQGDLRCKEKEAKWPEMDMHLEYWRRIKKFLEQEVGRDKTERIGRDWWCNMS